MLMPAPEAQEFLVSYKNLQAQMNEGEATEATIGAIYKAYYAEMGGAGTPPDVRPRAAEPAADNVTAFRRPDPKPKKASFFGAATAGATQKRPLPGLCRDQALLALSRLLLFLCVRRREDDVDGALEPVVGQAGGRLRDGIGFADNRDRRRIVSCIPGRLDNVD